MSSGAPSVPVYSSKTISAMKIPLILTCLAGWALNAQIIVQSGLTHRLEVAPGGSETVPVSIKNVGAWAMDCHLEISDVRSTCDSGYQYLSAGTTAESCADWLQLEQDYFSLEPGEEKLVKVKINCPASVQKAGARACVLVNSKPTIDSVQGLKVRVRYAINFLYRNPFIPG